MHVVSRPAKLGLGTAYRDGFRWGLAHGFDPIIQMDADGSHDPAELPAFADRLRRADAVVGSRYLGGIRVMNWPWMRLLLSYFANWYARLVTGVPLTDLTGGFNGWRAGLLRRIRPERLRCNGYAFQIELKFRALRARARFAEVPIVFTGRVEGESKLSRSVVREAIFAVWKLRLGLI
jgi:dolichol-phosphate mannosyltransferase